VSTTATTHRFGPVRLGDRIGDRDNNFDILRLLAAWAVLVSHSFALVGEVEPLHQLDASLGAVGVLIFFSVSGLLIRRSWEYDPSPRDFWIKRALRLLPALAVVGLVTAFVLGPLVTSVSLRTYFGSWETWIYPVRITLLFPFGAGLPGVFEDLEYAGAVNGPLWSLPVEVFAYAGLAVLGVTGLLRRRGLMVALSVLGLAWAAVWISITNDSLGAIYVLAAFAVSATAYSFKDRIVLTWPLALGALVLCVLSGLGPDALRVVVWSVCAVYLCCWFAYALPPIGRRLTRLGDASYGVYIWAWPVQQATIELLGGDPSPWAVIAITTPIVWLLAQASWHLVEAPALKHKPRPTAGLVS
jgi:peptidoglycan/LPS O-acetylase OafA/YrhL